MPYYYIYIIISDIHALLYIHIIYMQSKYVLQPFSKNVLNAVKRATHIYIYIYK